MKWQARAAAGGRFPLTSHPLAGPWECKDSIDILSRRNALLPARASKGNSVFPPTLTPAFLPSPSFWFPSVEFASSKTAKLSAFATRASGEREKAFHPWRHTKVTWTRFWALCLAGPAWPEGVWPDPCQPQHPAKVLSGLSGYAKVKWDFIVISLLQASASHRSVRQDTLQFHSRIFSGLKMETCWLPLHPENTTGALSVNTKLLPSSPYFKLHICILQIFFVRLQLYANPEFEVFF